MMARRRRSGKRRSRTTPTQGQELQMVPDGNAIVRFNIGELDGQI
jgi:hypothetical protein